MKTIVYVDAFNLYYGALKDTPYKWLDILKLSQTGSGGLIVVYFGRFENRFSSAVSSS